MVIGEHSRGNDLVVNVTKTKKLTNMRSSGADDKVKLAPPIVFTLEEAMEYIQSDEYVEVTPQSIRLRKIFLDKNDRKRAAQKAGKFRLSSFDGLFVVGNPLFGTNLSAEFSK